MTRLSLKRRLDRLESLGGGNSIENPCLVIVDLGESAPALRVDERVVIDRFRDTGSTLLGRERVTSQPSDNGRSCEVGGCLEDILEQLHQGCYWRWITGACRMCEGTPIAGAEDRDAPKLPRLNRD